MAQKMIGRYEIKSELGQGGMASVILGYDPTFKREVAIKVLPRELVHNTQFRARFEREATIVASLEHPAIVPVYDFGEHDGQPYLVMRLMSGKSLTERIEQQGSLPLEQIGHILERIAPALDYAHGKGIVHRDIKPANILFDQHGEPYISDFGIARLSDASATITGTAIVGTPAYMSPEQIRGDTDIDGRSDLYSLGVMLFEMLTGALPFDAATPTGQMMKHLTEPVPELSALNAQLPKTLQPVIEYALAKDKNQRFQTAQDLVETFKMAVQGKSVEQKLATLSQGVPRAMRRNVGATWIGEGIAIPGKGTQPKAGTRPRAGTKPRQKKAVAPWSIIGGVIGLLLLSVVGLLSWQNGLLGNKATPTSLPTMVAELPTHTPQPEASPTTEPSATPTEMVEITPTKAISATVAVPTATPEPVTVSSGPVIGGADKLAFLSGNDVWITNLDGTEVERLTISGGSKTSLQWSPDGQSVLFVAGRCVQIVEINTKQIRTVFCANWSNYIGAFKISPDQTKVAFSLSEGFFIFDYDLTLISQIRTKEQLDTAPKCISYNASAARGIAWSRDSKQLAVVTLVTVQGRQVEMVQLFNVERCGQPPIRVDQFPGDRFTMLRYDVSPKFTDFAWNGTDLFALSVNTVNDFGQVYIYNTVLKKAEIKEPVGRCCYRGYTWSPDGDYFIFTYQDSRYLDKILMYYIVYGTIDSGADFQPIPLPDSVFLTSKEDPQPVLRPANRP